MKNNNLKKSAAQVFQYHEQTKQNYNRYAKSSGYMEVDLLCRVGPDVEKTRIRKIGRDHHLVNFHAPKQASMTCCNFTELGKAQ